MRLLLQRIVIGYLNFNQSYVMSIAKYEDNPNMRMSAKVIYFVGLHW